MLAGGLLTRLIVQSACAPNTWKYCFRHSSRQLLPLARLEILLAHHLWWLTVISRIAIRRCACLLISLHHPCCPLESGLVLETHIETFFSLFLSIFYYIRFFESISVDKNFFFCIMFLLLMPKKWRGGFSFFFSEVKILTNKLIFLGLQADFTTKLISHRKTRFFGQTSRVSNFFSPKFFRVNLWVLHWRCWCESPHYKIRRASQDSASVQYYCLTLEFLRSNM